jgi:hypothetical protein
MKVIILSGLLLVGLIVIIIKKIRSRRDQFIHLGSRFDEMQRRI